MIVRGLLVAGLLVSTGCMAADGPGEIPPVAVAGARSSPKPLVGRLRLPSGAGPHAVVILLHGCGGLSRNVEVWADRLAGWGYGSLILDSFTPRSVASVCAPSRQRLVTRQDRAGDVVAAARWLQGQPGVDRARIAVIGFSHGGSTAATMALHPFADALVTDAAAGLVKGTVNYYGNCRDPERYAGVPLLSLAGEADDWGPPAATCAAFDAAVSGDVALVTYPGAVHSFDNPALVTRRASEGHPQQYDPAAAADSFARVQAFLKRTVGAGG